MNVFPILQIVPPDKIVTDQNKNIIMFQLPAIFHCVYWNYPCFQSPSQNDRNSTETFQNSCCMIDIPCGWTTLQVWLLFEINNMIDYKKASCCGVYSYL